MWIRTHCYEGCVWCRDDYDYPRILSYKYFKNLGENSRLLVAEQFTLEECCEMCKHRDISRFEDTCYECICGKNHFEAKYPDEIKELLADNPRWTRNSAM